MSRERVTVENPKTIAQRNAHPALDVESLKEADARLRSRYLFDWLLMLFGCLLMVAALLVAWRWEDVHPGVITALAGAGYLLIALTALVNDSMVNQ